MSLDWNLSKIEGHQEMCWVDHPDHPGDKKKQRMWHITEALIWATISVDMGEITALNWKEFAARLRLVEQANGPFFWDSNDRKVPQYITPEQVKQHIGLKTNVFYLTRKKWAVEFVERQLVPMINGIERKEENEES